MFSSFITDTAVVVIVLGAMILVHELGHFLAAKWFGVRVLVFSLGFGKRLFGFKRGDTDYRISALPFGGYVKMAGDDPHDVSEEDPGQFLKRPRWQRFGIIIMGPIMNVLMAVVLLASLYRYHFQKPAFEEQPVRLGDIEKDSPAAKAGLKPGDLIERLDGLQNPKWEDVEFKILATPGVTLPLEVLREGQKLRLTITPKARGEDRIGYVGWAPCIPAVVEAVEPGLPAAHAGLKPGDQIVALDGRTIYYSPGVAQLLQAGKGKPVDFTVRRQGEELHIFVKPIYSELAGEKKWRIGVAFPNEFVVRQLPWGRAFAASVQDNVRNCLLTFDVLAKILTRRMSASSLGGPIRIAQLSGEAYRAGLPFLFSVVAFISLQLGIFNLLPIPVLDGGMILLLLIEGTIRRELSIGFKERFVQVGIAFLLFLAVFVMYNDIVKTIRPY